MVQFSNALALHLVPKCVMHCLCAEHTATSLIWWMYWLCRSGIRFFFFSTFFRFAMSHVAFYLWYARCDRLIYLWHTLVNSERKCWQQTSMHADSTHSMKVWNNNGNNSKNNANDKRTKSEERRLCAWVSASARARSSVPRESVEHRIKWKL